MYYLHISNSNECARAQMHAEPHVHPRAQRRAPHPAARHVSEVEPGHARPPALRVCRLQSGNGPRVSAHP